MAETDNDEDDTVVLMASGNKTAKADPKLTRKDWLSLAILVATYFICLAFGVYDKTDAMKIIAAFGAVTVVLINLDRFSEITIFGNKLKLRELTERVNEIEDAVSEGEKRTPGANAAQKTSNFAPAITADYIVPEPNEQKVMKAIYNSKFVYRTVSGIAEDSDLSKDAVQLALDTLADEGFVERKITSKRNWLWKLTNTGKALAVNRRA